MRITNKIINSNITKGINNCFESIENYQQMVSTGKKIDRLSDDPITATRVLTFRSELRNIEQYQANIDNSTLWLNMNESLLTKAKDLATEARTEALTAANDTVNQTTRDTIATSIAGIRSQLLDIANTKYQNRYVFGGFSTNTTPYTDAGAYVGNSGQICRRIGPGGLRIQINMTGPEVFQSLEDAFTVLTDLETALRNGDSAAISAQADKLATVQSQLVMARSDNGARMTTLEMASTQLEDSKSYMEEYISVQEDADYTEALTNLANAQNIYQASLAASTALMNNSLLDYIK